MKLDWLNLAKQLQAIAQAGITFTESKYDKERYEQIRDLSVKIIEQHTNLNTQETIDVFASGKGYQTPKIDFNFKLSLIINSKTLPP